MRGSMSSANFTVTILFFSSMTASLLLVERPLPVRSINSFDKPDEKVAVHTWSAR